MCGKDFALLALTFRNAAVDRLLSGRHVVLFSYFMSQDMSTKSLQNGVFRTNCVDSLDRTNVVQSMLAAKVLHQQFVVSLHAFRIKFFAL